MDWLEEELKQALAREAPPEGFARRLNARAPKRRVVGMRRWMAAAAAVVIISGSGAAWRHRQGMAAKEQVMLAMRITAGKLNHIQERMREVQP